MSLLNKYKTEIIISILLLVAFFLTRIYNIMSLPLFTDEAIYVRWSQIARYDPAWRFISLTDGKQPSFVWITMVAMKFVKDPLLAGRLVSVGSGFFTLIGIFFLGKEVFKNKWVGFISSFIYLIFPMALVYNRMALYESLVGTFAVWSLYLEVLLIRKMRLDIALILGMVIGGGVLTKTSGFFSIYLLPFSLILFDLKQKQKISKFLKWVFLAIIVVFLSYFYYSVLRLFPFFNIIGEKNSIFVYPFHDWIKHPFEFFVGNFLGVWDWFIHYVSWPIIFLIVFSLLLSPALKLKEGLNIKKIGLLNFINNSFLREKILLLIWFSLPFTALALFGRVLYPRFIFFMTLSLIPLAALSFYKLNFIIKNRILFVFCSLILISLMVRSDYFILTDFARAPIPSSDSEQYINGWPAGGGVKEIISFLQKEAEKGKIYVASEGTFGSLPTYAVEIYLGDNKNVEKRGIWPPPAEIPKDLLEKSKKMPTFFIFNTTQEKPANWPLRFISKYKKGIRDTYMSLYQVESK